MSDKPGPRKKRGGSSVDEQPTPELVPLKKLPAKRSRVVNTWGHTTAVQSTKNAVVDPALMRMGRRVQPAQHVMEYDDVDGDYDEDDDNSSFEDDAEPVRVRYVRRPRMQHIQNSKIVYVREQQTQNAPQSVASAVKKTEDYFDCLCGRWCNGCTRYFVNFGCCSFVVLVVGFTLLLLIYYANAVIRSITH